MKILGLLAGAALLLGAQSAHAVTITNGSFETGTAPNTGLGYTALSAGATDITGWTVGAAGVDYIGTAWTASDGDRSIDMSNTDAGSLSQTLNGLHIGQHYTVSFDLAGNPFGGPTDKLLQVSVGGLPAKLYTFDITGQTGPDMGWVRLAYEFTADATSATLQFLSLIHTANGPALDNVSIATTPIPGAFLLFGTALGGMGFLGFRRKKLEAAA
jgi:choice-of-anchor C domain-containing protein